MPEIAADVVVRPMVDADVPTTQEMSYNALRNAGKQYGWQMEELDDDGRAKGQRRLRHALRHDPDGCFVADAGGDIVGVGIATRREKLWFLSLLAVSTDAQSRGIGRRLLDATLRTLDDLGALCASDDPKALRRYRTAGFDLVPCYEAKGKLDRARLPANGAVRPAALAEVRDFIEDIAAFHRGAPHGVDLDYFDAGEAALFVTDTAAGRGYTFVDPRGPAVIGATTPTAARALLWTALAESGDEPNLFWITHAQQWALDVALEAGLSLGAHGSRCVKGDVWRSSPYIPSGGWG